MVNQWGNYDIATGKIFKLGPLECATSSFINALILWKKNYHLLLLNYWNVAYYKKLLLGSRNLNLCSLFFLYGITIQTRQGKIQDIVDLLDQNNMAIVLCKGSQLAFFPARYLSHENWEGGLGHTFLVYGYNRHERSYQIVDAMADYCGSVPTAQLEVLKDPDGNLSYFSLRYDELEEPRIDEIFTRATANNYMLYTQEKLSYGYQSFVAFANDIRECIHWDPAVRDQWLELNCITISSLINNRSVIWNSFKEIKLLNLEEERLIEEKINVLIKNWKLLVFLLVKCKKAIHQNICEAIGEKLKLINGNEGEILGILCEAGQRVYQEKQVAG